MDQKILCTITRMALNRIIKRITWAKLSSFLFHLFVPLYYRYRTVLSINEYVFINCIVKLSKSGQDALPSSEFKRSSVIRKSSASEANFQAKLIVLVRSREITRTFAVPSRDYIARVICIELGHVLRFEVFSTKRAEYFSTKARSHRTPCTRQRNVEHDRGKP